MNITLCALLCLSMLLPGCAKVTVTHVKPGDTSDGVHFSRPRPYLLVSSQGKDLKGEIIWLPDPSQEYTVNLSPGIGRTSLDLKLKDGWMLLELGGESDSRFPESVSAFGNVLEAARTASSDPVGLYRIDIDAQGNVKLKKQEWMNP